MRPSGIKTGTDAETPLVDRLAQCEKLVDTRIPVCEEGAHFVNISGEGSGAGWHVVWDEENHIEELPAPENVVYWKGVSLAGPWNGRGNKTYLHGHPDLSNSEPADLPRNHEVPDPSSSLKCREATCKPDHPSV
jgi:hypothetical protein